MKFKVSVSGSLQECGGPPYGRWLKHFKMLQKNRFFVPSSFVSDCLGMRLDVARLSDMFTVFVCVRASGSL